MEKDKSHNHTHSHNHMHSHEYHEGHDHSHGHCHEHSHGHSHEYSHEHGSESDISAWIAPAISFILLIAGLVMSHYNVGFFENRTIELCWYIVAFLPVGLPVIKEAFEGIREFDFFNEFTLMVIACIGAFCIGEYPEAVGVMLFYSIGESLQDLAVGKATHNISKLLDVRSEHATVMRNGKLETIKPEEVQIGEMIEVKPGERVPLDGIMQDGEGVFDTSALTGESVPRSIDKGEEVLAGMISSSSTIHLKVNKGYGESALTRILEMVREANGRKAHTELFIRRFARVYTPIVILLAVFLVLTPWIVSLVNPSFHYIFSEWLYRGLVFLVISCPCALVISVPLGYFAGIGAASRCGILFKGGNYLEAVTKLNIVAFDKTGTLTTGQFSVDKVESGAMANAEMLRLLAAAEVDSSHPLAKALVKYAVEKQHIAVPKPEKIIEIAGHGTESILEGHTILAGNLRLLQEKGVPYPVELEKNGDTMIVCAIDGEYVGYATLSDTIKSDSVEAVSELKCLGIQRVVMLSGDRKEIVSRYAAKLGIDEAHGELLPQDKASYVENRAKDPDASIAFVGDGMNDAPVLALSNVGIAMGGLGSDAAIESADVVIQTDKPSRVATAIKIGRHTHNIVMENIVGAIGIKVIILTLGALGYASLWAAVFADVGVALLAVLNSMRIMIRKY